MNAVAHVRDFNTVGEAAVSALTAAELLSVRDRIAVAALSLVGRPYRHLGRGREDQHGGFDNVGFARASVMAATGERTLDDLAVYSPAWDADRGVKVEHAAELLTNWGFRELAEGEAWAPGDVLVFAMPNASMAVLTRPPCERHDCWRIAHAYWGRAVVESWCGPWWCKRLAKAFRFVGLEG